MQNPLLLKICGCLPKNRAQSVKIKKKTFSKILIFCPVNEKHHKSVGFQDFFEIFSTWSVMTPLFYICGSTLLLEGLKKPKYSCG